MSADFLVLAGKKATPVSPIVVGLRYQPSNADSAYSTNHGATWTAFSSPDSSAVYDVAANSRCAVTVGAGGATSWRSTDGMTWTPHALPAFAGNWLGVCWAQEIGLFCAIGFQVSYAGTQAIATSADGITWTLRTTPVGCVGACIAWNGTTFCAPVTDYSAANAGTLTSPDGVTWTKNVVAAWASPGAPTTIAASGAGTFCCVEDADVDTYTSSNGVAWTTHAGALTGFVGGIVAWVSSLSKFVASGGAGASQTAKFSADGITWTRSTLAAGYEALNSRPCFDGTSLMVFADDVATGNHAGVLFSTDGGATFPTFVELPGTPNVSVTLVALPG